MTAVYKAGIREKTRKKTLTQLKVAMGVVKIPVGVVTKEDRDSNCNFFAFFS